MALIAARAFASVDNAIYQTANVHGASGPTAATASLVNSGTLTIGSVAVATAAGDAAHTAYGHAKAHIDYGISQNAYAGLHDSITLSTSTGILTSASASGTALAHATANYVTGIYQNVTAAGTGSTATASLTNTEIPIGVTAVAKAGFTTTVASVVYHHGAAKATASGEYGVYQEATAAGADTVSLANSGTLIIGYQRDGHCAGQCDTAAAYLAESDGAGIYQYADTPATSNVTLTNGGSSTLQIASAATANATAGYASAKAQVSDYGIEQQAYGLNSAVVGISNSGTLNILSTASASGLTGAFASAYIYDPIDQYANGNFTTTGSNASVSLSNSGSSDTGCFWCSPTPAGSKPRRVTWAVGMLPRQRKWNTAFTKKRPTHRRTA